MTTGKGSFSEIPTLSLSKGRDPYCDEKYKVKDEICN
jgi:hypothetical protein